MRLDTDPRMCILAWLGGSSCWPSAWPCWSSSGCLYIHRLIGKASTRGMGLQSMAGQHLLVPYWNCDSQLGVLKSTTGLDPADGVPWNSAHTGSRRIDQTSLESVQRRSFWREPSWLSRPLQPCSTPDQPGRTESAPLEMKILKLDGVVSNSQE